MRSMSSRFVMRPTERTASCDAPKGMTLPPVELLFAAIASATCCSVSPYRSSELGLMIT